MEKIENVLVKKGHSRFKCNFNTAFLKLLPNGPEKIVKLKHD